MGARFYLLSSLRDLSAHRSPLVPIFQISPDFVPHYDQVSDRMDGDVTTCPTNSSRQPGGFFEFMFLSPYPTWHLVVFGLLASSVGLVTIGGNLVVILSFVVVPSIRQPTNYFIASLAVSDLLIGVVSMPFYTVYLLFGEVWPLGENLCDLWLSVDYTLCMCSIYTVFCITVDRFCSVKLPAKYRKWRTGRKVGIAICLTWTIPMLVFFTSIFGWQHFVGKRTVPPLKCYVQYMEDALFNSLLQIGYFWITLSAMIALYVGIYKVALDLHKRSSEKRDKNMACLVSMAGKTVSQIGTVITMGYRANEQPPQYLDSPDYYNIVYNPPKDVQNDLMAISEFPELQNPSDQLINAKRPSRISLAAFSTNCKNNDLNCSLATQVNNQHNDSKQVTPGSQVIQLSSSAGHPSPREKLRNLPVSNKDDAKDYFKDNDDKEILLSPPRAKDTTRPCIVITNEAAEITEGQNLEHVVLYTPDSTAAILPNGNDARFAKCYSSQYNFQGSMCRFYPVMRPHSTTEIFVRPVTEELNSDLLHFGKPSSRKNHQNYFDVCNIGCLKNSRNNDCMTQSYTRAKDNYGSFNEGARQVKVFARLSTVNLNSITTCYGNRKQELIENYLNGVSKSQDFEGDRSKKDPFTAEERSSPQSPQDSQRASSQILINSDRSPCCQCTGNDYGAMGVEEKPDTTLENSETSMTSGFFNFVNFPSPPSLHILSPLKQHISSAYSGLNFPHIFGFVPHNSSVYSATSDDTLQKANLNTVDRLQAKTEISRQALSSSKQSILQSSISDEKGFSKSRFTSYFDFLKPASTFLSKLFDRTPSDDGSKSVVIENPHISDELEPDPQYLAISEPNSSQQREQASIGSSRSNNLGSGRGNFNLSSRIMEAIRSRSPSTGGKSSQQDPGNSDGDDDDDDDEHDDDDDDDSSSNDDKRSFKVLSNFGQTSIAFAALPSANFRSFSPNQHQQQLQQSDFNSPREQLRRCSSKKLSPSNSDFGQKRPSLKDLEQASMQAMEEGAPSAELCENCQQQQQQQQQQQESQQKLLLQNHYQQQQQKQLHEQKQQQRLASQHTKYKNRTRKALKTITIILGAFVTCWTPWHVLSMIMGFCSTEPEGCVSPTLYSISYWLCYLNSPINPFCYAFANQQFKQAFLRIIRFDWKMS